MTKSRKKPDDETKIQTLTEEVEKLNRAIHDQSKMSEMYDVLNKHETRIALNENNIIAVRECFSETNGVVKNIEEKQSKHFSILDAFMKKYKNDGPRVIKFITIFLSIILFIIAAGITYIGWYTQDSKKTERSYQKQIIEIYKERGKK